ncbi:MAG: transglutaminase domain-containing protein [Chloroflexi bacterium]|nr:transglutaminase domain-containing protein [Chloroflexota bacterium]
MTAELTSTSRWAHRFPAISPGALGHKLSALAQSLRSMQGWVTFALLFLVVLSVVWSVQTANWAENSALPLVALAGLVTGVALARVPLHGLILHGAALGIGSLTTLWFAAELVAAGSAGQGVARVGERLGLWLHAAATDGVSTDTLPFAVVLMVLTWLLGYLCAWFTFRHGKVWVALVLAGVGIVNNLNYLPDRHWSFFFLFLMFAILALAWKRVSDRQRVWRQRNIQYSSFLGLHSLYNTFLFGLIVVLLAGSLPSELPRSSIVRRGYEYLRWPVEELRGDFNRLFAGVPARKPLPYRVFDTTLPFQGPIRLSDEVVFTLKSSRPSYWRVRSYPTYTSQGWISGATQVVPMGRGTPPPASETLPRREIVTQEVALNFSPRILAAAGIIQGSDLELEVEVPAPLTYSLSVAKAGNNDALPVEIRLLAYRLKGLVEKEGASLSAARVKEMLPKELALVGTKTDATGALQEVTVRRPEPGQPDILAVRSRKRLYSSDRYAVTSSVSVATPQELRRAGEDYPTWVQDLYLQLPDTLPQRVIELARSLTARAETPYDSALGISQYLHTLQYSLDIPAPAYDGDGVDHLLFKVGAGYSDYFASAMAVMLRTVGVPARVAAGYGFGEMDAKGRVVVRDKNSHAWTEVFFPGYGWVEFEPTPGRELPAGIAAADDPTSFRSGRGLGSFAEEEPFLGDFGPSGRGFGSGGWLELRRLLWWVALGIGATGLVIGCTMGARGLLGTPVAVEGVYRKMTRLSSLAGLGPQGGQTPREYGHGLARHLPAIAGEIEVVVDTYNEARYNRRSPSEAEETTVREAWRRMRRTLLFRVLRRRL